MCLTTGFNIGENIKNLRKERELTQKQLADLVGVTAATITKYEKGSLEPNLETINKIEKALGVSVSELIDGGIKHGLSVGDQIRKYRKEKGLTQLELGQAINKSESTIRKYESNSVQPPISIIHMLAGILGVSSEFLIANIDDEVDISTNLLKDYISNFEEEFLDVSNRSNISYDKGFLDGLKAALRIIEGEDY